METSAEQLLPFGLGAAAPNVSLLQPPPACAGRAARGRDGVSPLLQPGTGLRNASHKQSFMSPSRLPFITTPSDAAVGVPAVDAADGISQNTQAPPVAGRRRFSTQIYSRRALPEFLGALSGLTSTLKNSDYVTSS